MPAEPICRVDNFGNILCACGQHELQYTERRLIYMYDATRVFVYTSCAIKYNLDSGKNSTNNSIRHIGYGASIFSRFFTKWISNVMYGSINKQF
jgi:hypothetical protein